VLKASLSNILTLARLLCDTSGTGKTALIFQGLCRQWGFYFVAEQGTNGIGVRDLESTINSMGMAPGWIGNIFKDRTADDIKLANQSNEDIVFNHIYKVMLARWILFRTFVEVVKAENDGWLPETAKYDWLLFQVLPPFNVNGRNPFSALMDACLLDAPTDILLELLTPFTPSAVLGSAFKSRDDLFFYVLDEAQVAGDHYTGAFSDMGGSVRWPVIQPIIRAWESLPVGTIRFILSGTAFRHDHFGISQSSGVGKDAPKWKMVHTTGDLTSRGAQELYISRYLPGAFLSSSSGTDLLRRAHEWLRGRYVT